MHRIAATNQGGTVPNQNPNGGRNVSHADESRQIWRPQDHSSQAGFRGREEDRDREYRAWRDRSYRDEERSSGERETRRWEAGRGAETGYSEDRELGRSTERYGQGQSGYSAGRYGEDRSQQTQMQNRNELSGYEDRGRDFGVDDRFTGRGRSSYWMDRPGGYDPERPERPERYGAQGGYGGGRGFEAERPGTARGYEQRGYEQRYEPRGYEQRGYEQRYEPRGYEQRGYEQRGYGGYDRGAYGGYDRSAYEQRMGRMGSYDQRTGYAGESGQGTQHLGYQSGGYGSQQDWRRFGEHLHRGTGPHRGKGPHGYQRSDERIREMVCEALSEDDEIDASQIQVAVRDGEVTLTGVVDNRHVKREAEDCVSSISGVRDVQNQLRVREERSSGVGASRQPAGQSTSAQSAGATGPTSGATPSRPETDTSGQDKKHRA